MPRLPTELWSLIFQHLGCMRIQRAARRRLSARLYFGHARRPEWPALRAHLRSLGALHLSAFANVRHEWRTEPASWLCVTRATARVIEGEAAEGLWGARSALPASI